MSPWAVYRYPGSREICYSGVYPIRDSGVYRTNHRFWATRPMTKTMIEWASGDVRSLFELYEAQVSRASPAKKIQCKAASDENAAYLRRMVVNVSDLFTRNFQFDKMLISHRFGTLLSPSKIGRFIGRNGSNIKQLTTNKRFFQMGGRYGSGEVHVYAEDDASLQQASALLRRYQ